MVPTKSNTFRYFLHDRVHPNVSGREWADAWISGRFYLKVVQAILIFGFETRVVTPRIVPAWAKGFDQDTSVFSMIGVTGLIP